MEDVGNKLDNLVKCIKVNEQNIAPSNGRDTAVCGHTGVG